MLTSSFVVLRSFVEKSILMCNSLIYNVFVLAYRYCLRERGLDLPVGGSNDDDFTDDSI